MAEPCCGQDQPKRKGFLARWIEKWDKKLEEKSRQQSCCAKPEGDAGKPEGGNKKGSCC